jgi:hypothetical protein
MEEKKLSVEDLIPFPKRDFLEIKKSIEALTNLTKEYIKLEGVDSLDDLERVKKQFVGHMQRFTVLFSKVNRFKGTSHVYLDEQRKRVKSEAIRILLDEGNNATNAGNLVYSSKYYTERIDLMEDLKGFFIKVDKLYTQFGETLKAIAQSISVLAKDRNYSNMD